MWDFNFSYFHVFPSLAGAMSKLDWNSKRKEERRISRLKMKGNIWSFASTVQLPKFRSQKTFHLSCSKWTKVQFAVFISRHIAEAGLCGREREKRKHRMEEGMGKSHLFFTKVLLLLMMMSKVGGISLTLCNTSRFAAKREKYEKTSVENYTFRESSHGECEATSVCSLSTSLSLLAS